MFEFGGHANLAGLSLLDIRASLDSPIYFPEWPTIEICCIFVPQSVQICLQSSKIRPPNLNVDKCVRTTGYKKTEKKKASSPKTKPVIPFVSSYSDGSVVARRILRISLRRMISLAVKPKMFQVVEDVRDAV